MQATYKDVVCKDHRAASAALKKFEFESNVLTKTNIGSRRDMNRACVLLVGSGKRQQATVKYASSNCEAVVGWKEGSLAGRRMSALMSDACGSYHQQMLADDSLEFDTGYFGKARRRFIRDMHGSVYRTCDVSVCFMTSLSPSLDYAVLMVSSPTERQFLVANSEGALVGRSSALEWADARIGSPFGEWKFCLAVDV